MQRIHSCAIAVLTVALAASSTSADATQQRSFVSTSGNDANACSLLAPCRTFGAAIAQTNAGGEVVVLDSGGYGAFTINKSVSITSPPGIYAGISVLSTANFGIDITIASIDVVVLKGLTINNQSATSFGGIRFISPGKLVVDGCTIAGFSSGTAIEASNATGDLVVSNSVIRANANGIIGNGSGTPLFATLERNRYEANTNGGVRLSDPLVATITDSTFARDGGISIEATANLISFVSILRNNISAGGSDGVFLHTSQGRVDAAVVGNLIYKNGNVGVNVFNDVGLGISSNITIANNTISENANDGITVLNASAHATLDNNVITRNGGKGINVLSSAVVNSRQNNTVKDNNSGESFGSLAPLTGI